MAQLAPRGITGLDRILTQLAAYPQFVHDEMTALTRKHARSLISSSGNNKGLIQIVPPASMDRGVFGSQAKAQGEQAVERDVWRVYGTAGDVYAMIKAKNPSAASGYWAAIKRKDYTAANGLARRLGMPVLQDFTTDDGAEHRKRRSQRDGRVKGQHKTFFVTDARFVRVYLKMKQALVGLLANALASQYDGRFGPLVGVPAWVSRHNGSWGISAITENSTATSYRVIISLEAKGLNRNLQRWFDLALVFRQNVMLREAPYALRAAAQKAGFLHA